MVATSADTPEQGLSRRLMNLFPMRLGATAIGVLVLIFATLVLYWPSFVWMAGEWSEGGGLMSHGYLISAIAIYLIGQSINKLAPIPTQHSVLAIVGLLGLSIVWLLGDAANVMVVQTVVLPFIVLLAVVAAFGWKVGQCMAFAILYLVFALPAWTHLQFIFQAITVAVVDMAIFVTGLPAYVDNNLIILQSGVFEIADACSGMGFILAGLSLSVLFGRLYLDELRHKASLIATVFLLSLVGNWIRVFGVIKIGHVTEMRSSLVDDHSDFGWMIFAGLLVPAYFFARWLEHRENKNGSSRAKTGLVGESTEIGQTQRWTLVIALFALSIGPAWSAIALTASNTDNEAGIEFPAGPSGWRGPSATAWDWRPSYAGVDSEAVVQYRSDTDTILHYKNVYLQQSQGREMIFFANDIAGDWKEVRNSGLSGRVSTVRFGEFKRRLARSSYGFWLIWYRYSIDEKNYVSDSKAKIWQAIATLKGRPRANVDAYAVLCKSTCENAEVVLEEFLGQLDQ